MTIRQGVDIEKLESFRSVLEGNPDKVLEWTTLERMAAAGDGGTTEMLSWLAAMAAAENRPARTICYEPAVALRCGMGCVWWDMAG